MARKDTYYSDYLALDLILDSQKPYSAGEAVERDEHLFIVVHQAFEIWFKQILLELGDSAQRLGQNPVPDEDMGRVVKNLERIVEIQRLIVQQFQVLETMTPLDFLDFRDHLVPASGFQSVQFRMLEMMLGLKDASRMNLEGIRGGLSKKHRNQLEAMKGQPTLFDLVQTWLERMPFLQLEGFDFMDQYSQAVEKMLAQDRKIIEDNPILEPDDKTKELMHFDSMASRFEALSDEEAYAKARTEGSFAFSHKAMMSALFIHLYRDRPILHIPYLLLSTLLEIDEELVRWRHRHVLLVQRMIGAKIGTGGSSGAGYLEKTVGRYRIFGDLWNVPTFLLPRRLRPTLTKEVEAQLGFTWG